MRFVGGLLIVGGLLSFLVGWGLVAAVDAVDDTSAARVAVLVVVVCAVGGAGDAWWASRDRHVALRVAFSIVALIVLASGSLLGSGLAT